ncbi:hypothetical protein Nepgr_011262 [Nepenthes gracilis]|uniref:Scarecrow-like protein 28 n=1 Tax=Nepenthes gracilis TaxID=150966 RepID=A0AAD3XM85_NEPGR|nr:hypothetical protein Nepgr_011262 [Nepenthes gracilis]
MLAGCSSTLLSPRHRLRTEASTQFQSCHCPLPSMSTQRLDLPCNFPRKDSRPQPIRPVGVSVEKQVNAAQTTTCSLKQSIGRPPKSAAAQTTFGEARREIKDEFWEKGKGLKRLADHNTTDESCIKRAKKKKSSLHFGDSPEGTDRLSLGQLGSANFWVHPGFQIPPSISAIAGLNSPQIPFSLTSSGDEERVCFVPSEVISPPLPPLSNNPWIESVVTEITSLGDKGGETSCGRVKEASGSSSSSDSRSSGFGLYNNSPDHEFGNGSMPPNPGEGTTTTTTTTIVVTHSEDVHHVEQHGFELVSLLLGCVEAISSRNVAAITDFISRLGDSASPRGFSPISRVTAYFTEALALRLTRVWPSIFHISVPRELDRADDDTGGGALRLLNQVSPIPKFIHFTANEILLRAFQGKDRVHIIDFDIKQGLQWPSLFQSLAALTNPPTHVRITGVGEFKQELIETGERLAAFAESLNLPFDFHPVVDRLEDVRLWMLHVKESESVAVNCLLQMHKTLHDGNGGAALRDFLGLIKSTSPTVVIMAEQEADHNEPNLEKRVCNSLKHYAAIFDAIDFSMPLDSPARVKIEEIFAREIRNMIACEGSDRFERHESFRQWRRLMEQGGFRCLGISEREMLQGRMLLKMYNCESYDVEKQGENSAALTLRWLDQPLYTVSAWEPVDVAGSSSSFSQPS